MSSREIAELTGKRHDNVMRDIREMMRELDPYDTGDGLKFEDVYKDAKGEERKYFNLPKRETLILVLGYDVKRCYAVTRCLYVRSAEGESGDSSLR